MCGRFEISALDQILATFDADEAVELSPRYNIAPSQQIPIVRQDDGRRTITVARWGLVPSWAEDASPGNRLINARSETIQSNPLSGMRSQSGAALFRLPDFMSGRSPAVSNSHCTSA